MRWSNTKYALMSFVLAALAATVGVKWWLQNTHPDALASSPIAEPLNLARLSGSSEETGSDKANLQAASAQVTVLFSPDEPVQQTLVSMIDAAQRSVLVQAYILSDDTISDALIRARKRGVNVEVLMDSRMMTQAKGSDGLRLHEAGIPVRLETRYDNAHNKVMIFDHDTTNAAVVTGSYNFTRSAQRNNAENIVIIRQSPATIQRYVENWRKHAEESMAYGENMVS